MSDLVKVKFVRNAPPYFEGDVAGWPEERVKELEALGVAERVVENVSAPAPENDPAKAKAEAEAKAKAAAEAKAKADAEAKATAAAKAAEGTATN